MDPELCKSAEWNLFAGVKAESGLNQPDNARAHQVVEFNLLGQTSSNPTRDAVDL
jgi:hypothetical protein